MATSDRTDIRFQGLQCTLTVRRPQPGRVLVTIEGRDGGELGSAPFDELARDLEGAPIELFIDARATLGATLAVSHEWAQWLQAKRAHLRAIHMLTGSKFIQLTAEFVRRFAQLGELMRIYADPAAFDEALAQAAAPRSP